MLDSLKQQIREEGLDERDECTVEVACEYEGGLDFAVTINGSVSEVLSVIGLMVNHEELTTNLIINHELKC